MSRRGGRGRGPPRPPPTYTPPQPPMMQQPRNVTGAAIWACEVEPSCWIPYDDHEQPNIEDAYKRGDSSCSVRCGGRFDFTLDFNSMVQIGQRGNRPIQRYSLEDEKKNVNDDDVNAVLRTTSAVEIALDPDNLPPGYDNGCTICLEDFAGNDKLVIMRKCSHCFCDKCIRDVLKSSGKLNCPVCGVDLR